MIPIINCIDLFGYRFIRYEHVLHILFRPLGEECIKAVAELTKLDINVIRTLPDFNCAVMGSVYSEYFKRNIQLITAIMGETYRPDYVGSYD